jgi:hypothetical protein
MRSCIQDGASEPPIAADLQIDNSPRQNVNMEPFPREHGFKRPRPTNVETSAGCHAMLTPYTKKESAASPFQIGSHSLRQRARRDSPKLAEKSTPDTVVNTPKNKKRSPTASLSGPSLIMAEQSSTMDTSSALSISATDENTVPVREDEPELCSPDTMKLVELTEMKYAEREQRRDHKTNDNDFIYSFVENAPCSAPAPEPEPENSPPSSHPTPSQEEVRTVLDFGSHDPPAHPPPIHASNPAAISTTGEAAGAHTAAIIPSPAPIGHGANRWPPTTYPAPSGPASAPRPAPRGTAASSPPWSGPGGEPPDLLGLPPACIDAFAQRGIRRPYEWQRACLSSPRLLQV